MTMGAGLEADLNHIFEQPVPHSRLRRLSTVKKGELSGPAPVVELSLGVPTQGTNGGGNEHEMSC